MWLLLVKLYDILLYFSLISLSHCLLQGCPLLLKLDMRGCSVTMKVGGALLQFYFF